MLIATFLHDFSSYSYTFCDDFQSEKCRTRQTSRCDTGNHKIITVPVLIMLSG